MNRRRRVEPHARDAIAAQLPRVDLDLALRDVAVGVLGANRRRVHAHRPHAAFAPQQRAQRVDGDEEVAAVLLHHRQQQVAAGVPRQLRVTAQHRQARQQHAPRLVLVRRQGQRALEHVARRQHAQLVAQLARTAAAVEHRHDRVDLQPRVALEPAQQARQPGAAAEAADVQLTESHAGGLYSPTMIGWVPSIACSPTCASSTPRA